MDAIGSILLSPWLSAEDREKVRCHSKENFTYIRYRDWSNPTKELTGRLNKVTREVMWDDPPPIVGFKQFLLLGCHIPYTVGHLLVHPIKCICHISEIPERIYGFVRTAYYMTGMAVALILGVLIDPIKTREAYGLLDFHHNGDIEYSKSFTRLTEKQVSCWDAANQTEACYFAKCMQPWIRNFDEVMNCNGFLGRRYHVIQQSDKMEEIDFGKDEKGNPKKREYCDWALYPILPCLRNC